MRQLWLMAFWDLGDVHPAKSRESAGRAEHVTAPVVICQTSGFTASVDAEGPTGSPATVTAKGNVPAEVSFVTAGSPTSPQLG